MISDEAFVVVSIADNGVVHAWGDGSVLDNGRPYATRREAVNSAARARRHAEHMHGPGRVKFHVCPVRGSDNP